jgi:hypothetical protein
MAPCPLPHLHEKRGYKKVQAMDIGERSLEAEYVDCMWWGYCCDLAPFKDNMHPRRLLSV